jgi:GH25 family lysozyme M1 (1,4-beta-N-acetylmuramidase)
VDASGTPLRVRGIDVSYYQGTIDWPAVAATDIRFAVVRLSDGVGTRDSQFVRNWQESRRAGLIRGFYQYFRASAGGAAQAQLAVDRLAEAGGFQSSDLPPVLDIETLDGRTAAQVAAEATIWVDAMREATGKEPIIYTGAYFWDDNRLPDSLNTQPLWTANYTTNPCPWTSDSWDRWTLWQYSDSGTVSGIAGPVDLDYFAGTLDDLQNFANATIAPTCEPDCPTCVDRCSAIDLRTCIGDATFSRCEPSADGCLGWGPPQLCPAGTVCEAGDCNRAPDADTGTTDTDTTADTTPDAAADTGTPDADTGTPDATADTGADTTPDAAQDAAPDTRADSAAADAQPDAEAPLDTQSEASETGCSAATNTGAGWLALLAVAALRRRRTS